MRAVTYDNYRVEIAVEFPYIKSRNPDEAHAQMMRAADDLAREARRHLDNIGSVVACCDRLPVCSHCGAQWTEDDANYNGGCCDADQEAEDARLVAVADAHMLVEGDGR